MKGTRFKATDTTISDLPENVIDSILERLPIEDAVKTSALARSWRYNWTTLSELTFGEDFTDFLMEKSLLESDFVSIITNILLVHRGTTIRKITLVIPAYHVREGLRNIHNWMICLSRKGVKEFTLDYQSCSRHEFCKLPSHLYGFLDLIRLEIHNCVFKPPDGFGGFPKLVTLTLYGASLDQKSFGCLISSCPLLEVLEIYCPACYHSKQLNIHSPSLTCLYVGGESREDSLESIHVNAENLTTLWLNGSFRMHLGAINCNNKVNNMIEELGRLPKIEELFIGGAFKTITAAGPPRKLPTSLIHLKRVTIEKLDFADPAQGISMLSLIRSSPNLQEIHIVARYRASNDVEQVSIIPREDWSLNCLQTVILGTVSGSRPEMEFIKFVLASSPSLELMVVYVDIALDDEVGSLISEELFTFYKASPRAEVLFKQHCRLCYQDGGGCDCGE